MTNRKSLIDEQVDTIEGLYKIYQKYVNKLSTYEWIIGACYIRVSTNEQDKFSPLSQLREILEYALKNEIYIPKDLIFQDIGKSGMKDIEKRIDFLNMMESAKNGKFKTLLLYKFSRLARAKEESVYYKGKLRKEYNINVISIREELPTDNSRVLVESIYEGQDEFYVLNFRDETKRGKKEKLTRGEWLGASPFGYTFDKNIQTLIIDKEKAKVVKFIFNYFYEMSPKNIKKLVCTLNSKKVLSPRGGLWSDLSIKRILRNPVYIGYMRHCEGGFKRNYDNENIVLYKGNHKPIIDEELFNEVQTEMKFLKEKHRPYMKPAAMHAHWLSCILKCGNCGNTLVRVACKGRKPYFQCTGYTKGYCNKSHHIREEQVVPLVLEQIKKDFTEKLDIKITKHEEILTTEINLLNAELEQLNAKLKRVKNAYQSGIDTLEEYKENKQLITTQVENKQKRIKTLEKQNLKSKEAEMIYKKCATAYEILTDKNASLELKKQISNELFDKIVYDKANEELIIHYKI